MTSQPGKQINVIGILPNILRRTGNQTIKFGQIIITIIRKIFLH